MAYPLLVVDATNLTHRAWFSFMGGADPAAVAGRVRDWTTQSARRVNAAGIVCAFDGPDAGAHRYAAYPQYKAGRSQKDPGLVDALATVPKALADAGWATFSAPGAEADDVLAGYAASTEYVVLLTSDKDAYGLLRHPGVRLLRPANGTPAASWPEVTAATMPDEVGVTADQWELYAACKGDASDAIPGLPGIGPGLAQKLATRLHTIDALEQDLHAGGPVTAETIGKGRAARLVQNLDETLTALHLAVSLAAPLPLPQLPSRDQLQRVVMKFPGGGPRTHVTRSDGRTETLF